MADALVLGTSVNDVGVQVPSSAPELRFSGAEHRDGGEHEREDDEDPVRRVLEHAERGAVVVDVRQLQHARNERDVPGVERDVDGDPVFEPLVSDEDQDGYDGIPHSGSSLSDQDFGSG